MIIARQKKKENIAEYLLYMYQIEDLIRANGMDIQQIEQRIINQFDTDYSTKREMLEWYKDLIHKMISEKKQREGHLDFLLETADKVNQLHQKMLQDPLNETYKKAYDRAKVNVEALRMRSGLGVVNDVQLALNGLYGLLMLKLQKKEISEETSKAFGTISEWMALLSAEYMQQQS